MRKKWDARSQNCVIEVTPKQCNPGGKTQENHSLEEGDVPSSSSTGIRRRTSDEQSPYHRPAAMMNSPPSFRRRQQTSDEESPYHQPAATVTTANSPPSFRQWQRTSDEQSPYHRLAAMANNDEPATTMNCPHSF
uniref:Uncharacterized protein n=1 Tax=Nelumbo nucifera TaxID=4432 RepID=A0A822XNH8_NELNU|nr:TPA_asm: hypothetical protein HUJ06_021768 [Nelumbo nucifera]